MRELSVCLVMVSGLSGLRSDVALLMINSCMHYDIALFDFFYPAHTG